MDDRKSEKSSETEIWLKYCEDCIKSKLEKNGDTVSNPSTHRIKKTP